MICNLHHFGLKQKHHLHLRPGFELGRFAIRPCERRRCCQVFLNPHIPSDVANTHNW